MKKFFIIAGEPSGDLLGSKLIKEIKASLKAKEEMEEVEFVGVGGKLMQNEGLISIFPMEELSVMGFFEVVPHLAKLLRRIRQTAEAIVAEKPNFIITIDSPDFCFRVMKKLKQQDFENSLKNFSSTKKIHLIAPSVWAYRQGRAKKISKLYDLLLTILPFEPPYFIKHGLKTVFIGHPLLANVPDFSKQKLCAEKFRENHKIDKDTILLAVTPGSRNGEVKKIFSEFIKAINLLSQKKSQLKVIIPLIDKTRHLVMLMAKELKVDYFFVEKEGRESAFFTSNFALAKSGTNTLEFSLYRTPMIVAYKVNFLTYLLAKMLLKIKFANLINLLLNREVIPEMLQKNCDGKKIAAKLEQLMDDENFAQKQIKESQAALKLIGLGSIENPSQKAVKEILAL